MTPAACSLTRFFRVFYGQRTSDMDVLRIQRTPSWRQPKFILLGDGVDTIANDQVKLYNFKFVAYTDIYRVWSGRYLLFPKSEPDLTVDGHDPYTLACKARPSFDRCWTSLSVSLSLSLSNSPDCSRPSKQIDGERLFHQKVVDKVRAPECRSAGWSDVCPKEPTTNRLHTT